MIRTQIYLPDEMHRELMLLATEGKGRFSDLVRQGVKTIIEKRRKQRTTKKLLGRLLVAGGRGGPKDLSRKIDYYLYGKGSKWADKKSS